MSQQTRVGASITHWCVRDTRTHTYARINSEQGDLIKVSSKPLHALQ